MLWLPWGPAGRGYVLAVAVTVVLAAAVVVVAVAVVVVIVAAVIVFFPEEDGAEETSGSADVSSWVCRVLASAEAAVSDTETEAAVEPLDTGSSPAAHPLSSSPVRQQEKSRKRLFFISSHLIFLPGLDTAAKIVLSRKIRIKSNARIGYGFSVIQIYINAATGIKTGLCNLHNIVSDIRLLIIRRTAAQTGFV